MKKRLYITSFTLFIISYFLIFPAFSQYTKSLYEKNSSQGFLGLSILDTDSVLKFAKESAAFDKPFFIKIKRLSKGSANPALAKRTDITTYTGAMVLPDTLHRPVPALPSGFVRASSVEIKTETPIPNPPTAKAPAKVVAIFLEGKKKHDELNANVHEFSPMATNGDVYEEKNDSEFIFIRIRPLKPEKSYKLTIVWRLDGEKFETEEYRFTTATQTLEKRLKQKIIPQIGVTAVLFKSTNSDGKVLKIYAKPSLMLGFHYYPRPIDPDISFSLKTYKPWALQRFSLLGGLTINTLAAENTRADLLGTSNIVVGVGYQLSDAFKISYGALLFYRLNPNKLFSDEKNLAYTSAITATLDIKLKDILGGIVTTLGFK